MNELENDLSASQESELRDELSRLQQDISDIEQATKEYEQTASTDHIIVQLESLQQKIDNNSALYREVQMQLDELRAQETLATKEQQITPENMPKNPSGLQDAPSLSQGENILLEQQAHATKQTLASDYEHKVTEVRSANKRLPQDWFSQKILQPTVWKLLQRMSMYIKTNGR